MYIKFYIKNFFIKSEIMTKKYSIIEKKINLNINYLEKKLIIIKIIGKKLILIKIIGKKLTGK